MTQGKLRSVTNITNEMIMIMIIIIITHIYTTDFNRLYFDDVSL